MDILEKLRKLKFTVSLDNVVIATLIIIVAALVIYLIIKLILKLIKDRVSIKTITINGISVDLECNSYVKKLANEVWIELSTRKIALPFDEENDVIVEVYNSWYEVFKRFREILKELPINNNKEVEKLSLLILKILNEELRGHLTKWQARFRKWYKENENIIGEDPQEIQKKYPQYKELVKDLKRVNNNMIIFTEELDKIRKEG